MDIIEPARVERREEIGYVGIRVVTPFRGMLRTRDDLLSELIAWLRGPGPTRVPSSCGCTSSTWKGTEPRKTKWVVELNIRAAGSSTA